jgi:hypothetical protein
MSKISFRLHFSTIAIVGGMVLALATSARAQTNSKGEEFFMVSSVDQQTHQVVLMRPTQLTVAATVGPQTRCQAENGQKMSPSNLKAGDTVWAIVKPGKSGTMNAVSIREGAMTQSELEKIYLHYTTSAPAEPPVKPIPLNPPPQSGTVQAPAAAPSAAAPSDATLRGKHRPGRVNHHPQPTVSNQ